MATFEIRPITADDTLKLKQFMIDHWGDERVVVHGQIYYPHELPGFVAVQASRWIGAVSYQIAAGAARS